MRVGCRDGVAHVFPRRQGSSSAELPALRDYRGAEWGPLREEIEVTCESEAKSSQSIDMGEKTSTRFTMRL